MKSDVINIDGAVEARVHAALSAHEAKEACK